MVRDRNVPARGDLISSFVGTRRGTLPQSFFGPGGPVKESDVRSRSILVMNGEGTYGNSSISVTNDR
jgi:hypothetical protein